MAFKAHFYMWLFLSAILWHTPQVRGQKKGQAFCPGGLDPDAATNRSETNAAPASSTANGSLCLLLAITRLLTKLHDGGDRDGPSVGLADGSPPRPGGSKIRASSSPRLLPRAQLDRIAEIGGATGMEMEEFKSKSSSVN